MIVAASVCVWFSLVTAYGLGQRAGHEPLADRSMPSVAVPAAAAAAQTGTSVATTVATATEEAAAMEPPPPAPATVAEQAPPPEPVAVPVAEPVRTPAPAPAATPAPAPARAPKTTSCDAVADLGTVEPGGRLAFRLDPRCPYRPGMVDIAINGGPPRPAQVDENGVVWVEVDE